jgi:hypothetical protein
VRNVPARLFRVALAASLSLSALLFFLWSWRWPLVGDASLMHYMGWLIERGWAPYRDFGDMNMPGSYLIELAAMHLFGTGGLAWRLFDFTLMGVAAASFFVITRRTRAGAPSMTVSSSWVGSENSWLAGLFAACLFILVHGRDGLAEGGQRDLTMAVCLIVATAFLFVAVRRDWPWAAVAFGLFSGVALTIKPTALPVTVAQLLLAVYVLHKGGGSQANPPRGWLHHAVAAIAGYLIAPAIALVFLLRERALAAFFDNLHGLDLYYSGLGHRPLGFLLLHSISPLLPLVLLWLAVLALRFPKLGGERAKLGGARTAMDWERVALFCGALFGLVSYLVQGRGFPYHRYMLLAFLLPLMAVDFTRSAQTQLSDLWRTKAHVRRGKTAQWLALAALSFGGFVLAPQSAVLIHRYRWWETDFITSLQQNLDALGGQRLSGHIQCIDSISGCGTALYRMRLEPANGLLVDFPIFGAEKVAVVRQMREQFSAAVLANPPQVIVVTSSLVFYDDGPGEYRKLDRWPAFQSFLAAGYTLQTEWSPTRTARWWSREEIPASYRIYVLRDSLTTPRPHPKRPSPGEKP